MESSDRFAGRKAMVTGAGGFIGLAICRALAAGGADVVGAEVSPGPRERVEGAGVTFALCDVTDPAQLRAAAEGAELIFHTAAFIHEGGAMAEFVDLNLGGTINVLDVAREVGAETVVHLSSVVVYGYENPEVQDEDAPLRTYGIPYLDTKSASDRIARRGGAVVVRPGDVYGPGSVPWTRRPLELASERLLAVPSRGALMLPVYVDDLVEACLRAAEAGEGGRAYAAWSGEAITFKDYFDQLVGLGGWSCPVIPMAALTTGSRAATALDRLRGRPPRLGIRALTFIDRRGSVSNARIRTELGWEPRVRVSEGVARIAPWARDEGLI